MKVKLTFIDSFESEFQNEKYKILQFANPVTFEIINGVNLENSTKLIPYEIYTCYIERKNKKWRVTKIES